MLSGRKDPFPTVSHMLLRPGQLQRGNMELFLPPQTLPKRLPGDSSVLPSLGQKGSKGKCPEVLTLLLGLGPNHTLPAAEVPCAHVSTLVCKTAVLVSFVLPTLQGSCPWAASPACRNPLCAVGPVRGPGWVNGSCRGWEATS